MVPVSTRPQDRTRCLPHDHSGRPADQTGQRRAQSCGQCGRHPAAPGLPCPGQARPGSADLLAPTALLSNIGVINEPIRFGAEAGDVSHLWFSPQAKMPYGRAIGAITYRSRLHISLWYRHPLFSADAARSFTSRP
jgi:hypothetical protein